MECFGVMIRSKVGLVCGGSGMEGKPSDEGGRLHTVVQVFPASSTFLKFLQAEVSMGETQ